MATRAETPTYPVPWKYGRFASWVATVDHKRIGILYIATSLVFFLAGGVMALLIRTQLATPDMDFVVRDEYNQLFTMHGTTMIFLVVVPIFAGFANYLVPLMIGAADMAFPRLNALSYWLFLFGGIVLLGSFFAAEGAARSGWTGYPPFSAEVAGNGQDLWIVGLHILTLSSLAGAINFVATIHNMRTAGMSWMRLPLFVWAMEIYAALLIVALPALSAGLTMLLLDRADLTHFFTPDEGGDAVLYQHVFWFFGHPEVYIMILPAMGIVSEVIPVFARKPIFGYKAIAFSTVAIGFYSLLVWGHHMFTVGLPIGLQVWFMIASLTIAVPTGVEDLQLDRDDLAREPDLRHGDAVGARVRRRLHDRRAVGDLRRRLPVRLAGARLVLRRRPPPLRALRRVDVRRVRGALLLVAEDVRPDAEREARQVALLARLHRLQPDVLPAAHDGDARDAEAGLQLPRHRSPGGVQPGLDDRARTSWGSGS